MIKMKKLIIGLLCIGSISSFAQSDNCVTATVINLDANGDACVNGTNVGATTDNILYGGCNATGINEVWYTYVATGAQNDFTLNPGTMQDAQIVVQTGACPLAGQQEFCDVAVGGASSFNPWGLAPGTQVWIGIGSNSLTDGTFQLCVNSYTPPPGGGNGCAGAIPVCSGTTVVDMNPMSSSGTFPSCFLASVNQDVWFTFDVLVGGTFEWSAVPSGASTGVELDWALYDITGGCPGAEVDCNYNYDFGSNGANGQTPGGTGEFNPPSNLIAGNTYAIVVDFFSSGATGSLDFSVDGGSAVIAPDADFTINPSTATCGPSVNVTITDNSIGAPSWDFGDGTNFVGNNPPVHVYNTPGTYAITASFGGACPDVHTEFVQLFGPVVLAPVGVDETCPGDCDGSASVAPTGGSGNYTYNWMPGGLTTPNINNLCAGNYTLTVTDAVCGPAPPANVNIASGVCPCLITNMTANISACNPAAGDYSTTGIVEFTNAPVGGQLIVQDCNGNQQVFNPPYVTPQAYAINGQSPDGLGCDVTAFFSSDPTCTQTIPYVAPTCPCNMDSLTANIGLCDGPTDTYPISGNLGFTSAPAGGQLIVQVDNGTTTYDTIINPPFIGPGYSWSISGIPSDGAASTVTVFFTADPGCSITIPYNAPSSCFCNAQIGTFTDNITGGSVNNWVLCFGDQIDITPNGDLTPPDEQFPVPPNGPPPPYDPGIWWFLYSCTPTVAVTPDPVLLPWVDDPCFLGAFNTQSLNDLNDMAIINSYPPGTFTDNIAYWIPITMYGMSTGTVSYVTGNTLPCYMMGSPYPVQYLPEFTSSDVEDCIAGTATVTVNGGVPELDGSNFTASNLLPATASFANTTATHGGNIVVTGLNGGEMWSFGVTDGNGCPYTVTGGPFPPLENPGFNYTPNGWCTNDPAAMPNITGVGGGTFASAPAGLTINPANGQITPATSTPGTYSVTYTTPGICFDDSTVTVTIFEVPTVNPVLDETVCEGANFTAINFTGSMAGANYNWINSNANIGLAAAGAGNIAAFPGATPGGQQVGTITVTPSTANCTGNSIDIILTVNPTEDPSFNYPGGLTYCQTGTDPTAVITGTAGGTFTFTPTAGGPFLDINAATGDVVLATSNLGAYDITYTTGGACTANSTLNMVITTNLIADFSFSTYCSNVVPDPTPNFIQDDAGVPFPAPGSGGVFSSVPAGLSINAATGVVDASASTPGTYTVTNTIPASGACPVVSYDDDITIQPVPDATIAGSATVCVADPVPDATLTVTNSTGDWTVNYLLNGGAAFENVPAGATPVNHIFNAGLGTYDLVSIVDNVTGCTNPIAGQIVIDNYVTPTVDPMASISGCEGDNIAVPNFTGTPAGVNFQWTNSGNDVGFGLMGAGAIGPFVGQTGTAVVTVTPYGPNPTANSPLGCVGPTEIMNITVNPNPVPSFMADTLVGCEPLTVTFTNTTANAQNCIWEFGDGNSVNDCGPVTNTYGAGTFDVTLTVASNDGCWGSTLITSYIEVYPQPTAAFTFAPQEIDVEDPVVEFTNGSLQATSYLWDFGDGTPDATSEDVAHEFPAVAGDYLVTLYAYNNTCVDSYQQVIHVQDVLIYYVPNIFTPDGDEFNETFQPIFTSGYDIYDFHLTIFNRWGERIFESYNDKKGWNGHYGDGGLVEDGVYIWQIEFKESGVDRLHEVRGHVTVLK